MRYLRSEDQEFFRATTARFLTELVPPAELRARRDDSTGFDLDYWRRGAELGWTSLLVDEAHGGGSISDAGWSTCRSSPARSVRMLRPDPRGPSSRREPARLVGTGWLPPK